MICSFCGDSEVRYQTVYGPVCAECGITIEDDGLEDELELEEVD